MTDTRQATTGTVFGFVSYIQSNKRFVLLCVIVVGLALQFWTTSRYPSLTEKATMGDEVLLEDPLGFDIAFAVDRADPVPIKVLKTTANWAKTNRKGMTFGVLFAAALMGMFAILRKRNFKSSIANSGLGILIGAPLGICVNCVTPVAQGVHNAGARLETTLAMMLSSPTLNIIVVTMLIALFPPYFVVIKLGLTLAFILFGLPLIAKVVVKYGSAGLKEDLTISDGSCPIDFSPIIDPNEPWGQAIAETAKSYFVNLWYIIRTAVPLMLLAGFLGAVVITLVPWDTLSGLFEGRDGRLARLLGEFGVALLGLSIIAAIGIFLPIPIAFDVMIVAILFSAGMPVHYAMTLLFTLGIFSIYPFFIIWKDISRSVAVIMPIVLSIVGVCAGLAAMGYNNWDTQRKYNLFISTFTESTEQAPLAAARDALAGQDLQDRLAENKSIIAQPVVNSSALLVEHTPFAQRTGGSEMYFEKLQGNALGIDEPLNFSLSSFTRPLEYRGTIATGDIHNDGWPDIVIGSVDHLVSVYANLGDGNFALQEFNLIGLPELSGAVVFLTSLVDLNDDGWLDLFFTTYDHGNWVVYNVDGEYGAETLESVPNISSAVTRAVSFGDFDQDGDLDGSLGNWVQWNHPDSQNALIENKPEGFEARGLTGMVSATLSTLLTDYNDDGKLDLIAGAEFWQPDLIYSGDGNGEFEQVNSDDSVFPHTTQSTMSIATADINNDLMPEIFFTQITGRSTNTGHPREAIGTQLCDSLSDLNEREQCTQDTRQWQQVRRSLTTRDTTACMLITDSQRREECVVAHLHKSATLWYDDASYCELLPDRWKTVRDDCQRAFDEHIEYSEDAYAENLPQIQTYNVLLQAEDDGTYSDRATDLNLGVTGWTWNSKFADLNNDEWVDLFAVNGNFPSKIRESNYFYQSVGGEQFVDKTVEAGLVDFFPTAAYSYVDLDNDGDLDIVTAPVHGPVSVYKNATSAGNSISFKLRDMQGNRFGVGSRVVIRYGDGSQQMREIQSGGGFSSFDPAVAHFGLGGFDEVSSVEIRWSTSETDIIAGPFKAGGSYQITRKDAVSEPSQ